MRLSLALPLVCALLGVADIFVIEAFSTPSLSARKLSVQTSSPLFQRPRRSENNGKIFLPAFPSFSRGKDISPTRRWSSRWFRSLGKMRRTATVLCTALMFWFGAAGLRTPPSHASTQVAPASESRSFLSASLDQIADRYVKDHMFDDDVYEPVESAFREAVGDKIQGRHPKALSEITSSVLGQGGVKTDSQASAKGVGGFMLSGINFLKGRGLSETAAILVLTGTFVVAGPIAFLCFGMMVGNQSKRQLNSVMKKRYGDTYTVDATIKVEDDVETPDEDEDDDVDDDDEADDDDDDDDDDDED